MRKIITGAALFIGMGVVGTAFADQTLVGECIEDLVQQLPRQITRTCGRIYATHNQEDIRAVCRGIDGSRPVSPSGVTFMCQSLADSGDIYAENAMGIAELSQRNSGAGIEWLRKSAEQGYSKAQLQLGSLLLNSQNDPTAARPWLEKAAAAGDKDAAELLARLNAR